ncbi:MAG: 4'-phosphopantetheinyl transferase superfamily protein [Nostoc sp. NMS1]|uniref:4'-phosphopantetheinyl transferase HetI n=1 Tax=unclassified Nostoc TaxID=2593658 RepID=UPI0025F0628A|nr:MULTISPECIES: 4'-phosphopantetheinyl transferase HetI [unclassified Nostoc]MBN3910067.1 4'-phosphopantetheinyl transferase superfamily protein [Nostoc sp. NMS1]MBN3992248.1 4'-phosphopantetheinyl transferase superfamily protein [Nostoc sp. NMS2]
MTATHHHWLAAPTDLTLLPDEIHVWRIELDQPELQLQNLAATLSSDETARAERFYFQEHRQRFIAGRGILRTILGRYLGIQPLQVQFNYQQRGKPVLADTFADSGLAFNLSHSQGLGLCAVNCTHPIGVDLEYIRPMSDLEALAKRFFLPREYDMLRSLSLNQQQEVFFRYWTCKEAYLKATGDGLSQLEQIEVSLTPTEPAKLQILEDWSLFELVPANNYVAAVAIANCDWNLKCWQY